MVYHRNCALNIQFSRATKEHFLAVPVPYGGPLWRNILTVWGHRNESAVHWRFLSFFEALLETFGGIETGKLMRWSYVGL